MANKWKYSTLPASERIAMVKNGDKDVYDNEVARSVDVINSRNELGLDITEQKNWIDTLSYNYNLGNASKMGIDASKVNKTGYADYILESEKPESGKRKYISMGGNYADFVSEVEALRREYEAQNAETEGKLAHTEEWLLNNGISKDSADGKKYLKAAEDEINEEKARNLSGYKSKVKALGTKYGYKVL